MARERYKIEYKPGRAFKVSREDYNKAVVDGYVIPGDYRYGVIAGDVVAAVLLGCLTLRKLHATDGVYVLTNFELIRRKNPTPCVEVE